MVDKDDKVNDKYIEDTRKYNDDMEEYAEDTKKYIEDKEEQNEDMENKEEESKPIDQEPDWERPAEHPELYDLTSDPWETVNLYKREDLSQVREELSARLRIGWRGEARL